MLTISLTIACSRYTYDGVILPAHPVRGESHNQRNTTGEVATLQTSQKAFVESAGQAAGIEPTFAVSSESYNHICRNFWQLRFIRKFFTRQ